MSKYLAIDYGEKRIGAAISDENLLFAFPFKCFIKDKTFKIKLEQSILEKNISKIIIGNPLNQSGESGEMSRKIQKFYNQLTKWFDIECILWDERYTTSQAIDVLKNSKAKTKQKKGNKDIVAAVIILQSYLDYGVHFFPSH